MAEVQGYRTTARAFHWLVALAVLTTIPAGLVMVQEGLPRSVQNALFIYHKNLGVLIFLLVALRLLYRQLFPPPPLPESVPAWQQRAAGVSHAMLYVMLFFMTITGYTRVEAGGFPIEMLDALGVGTFVPESDALEGWAKAGHYYGRYVLGFFILAHVGAAAYHGLIRRDGVFSRIWPIRAGRAQASRRA